MYRPYALMFLYIVWKKKEEIKVKKKKKEKEKNRKRKKKKSNKGDKMPQSKVRIKSMHKCCEMKRKCMSMWKSERWVVRLEFNYTSHYIG